ncbi:hypothetical protein HPB47_018381, partial [Ixodes persulcatus]
MWTCRKCGKPVYFEEWATYLEGSIRIYWGVNRMIRLKEEHDDRIPVRRRRSSLRLSRLSVNLRDRE